MKTLAGVLVVAAVLLTACGAPSGEGAAQVDESSTLATQESALRGNCYVRVECADGSTRSCDGSSGACSANGGATESVTCNGVTSYCPAAPPPVCNHGAGCTTNSQCGVDGFCTNKRCVCA